jgi:hypothetical protein
VTDSAAQGAGVDPQGARRREARQDDEDQRKRQNPT